MLSKFQPTRGRNTQDQVYKTAFVHFLVNKTSLFRRGSQNTVITHKMDRMIV